MKIEETKKSLQKLITRLQDAEKGYLEIAKSTDKIQISKMASIYAQERHFMHKTLESNLEDLGGEAEDGTSFVSSLHRAWIDIKVSGWGDNFIAIVNEIETGSKVLIDEYQFVLDNTDMHLTLRTLLTEQQERLILELNELIQHRENLLAVNA